MNVVRLPSWNEILAPQTPWGLILRAGGGGLWLLRGAADERADRERTLRVVFQSRFETRPELPDVLLEFGAADVA